MNTSMANSASITTASVWLYLTEKGREKKKKPFKYWMNNSEIFFEVSYVHPTHVFDVPTLLTDAYKSFLQSALVVTYDTERKKDAPVQYPAESCFVNPIIENMNLITWTSMGWTIPFRCTICLPIDKIKYLQLFINGWAIEFTLYAKASSKNKLEAGAPQLFSILGEMQRAMVGQQTFMQPAATAAPQFYDASHSQAQHYVAARNQQNQAAAGNFVGASDNNFMSDLSPDGATIMRGTTFDPEFELDPALGDNSYASPHTDQSVYTTSDSSDFDSIISNYPEFEEKVQQDIARAREKETAPEDGSLFTEKDRAKKRRLQGPATNSKEHSHLKSQKTSEKKKKLMSNDSNFKKVKKEQLLTPKKEGDKFTQYYPTNVVTAMEKTSLHEAKEESFPGRAMMPGHVQQNVFPQPVQQPPATLVQQMLQQTPSTGVPGQLYYQASGVYHIGSVAGAQLGQVTHGDNSGYGMPSNTPQYDEGGDEMCIGGFGMAVNPLQQKANNPLQQKANNPLQQKADNHGASGFGMAVNPLQQKADNSGFGMAVNPLQQKTNVTDSGRFGATPSASQNSRADNEIRIGDSRGRQQANSHGDVAGFTMPANSRGDDGRFGLQANTSQPSQGTDELLTGGFGMSVNLLQQKANTHVDGGGFAMPASGGDDDGDISMPNTLHQAGFAPQAVFGGDYEGDDPDFVNSPVYVTGDDLEGSGFSMPRDNGAEEEVESRPLRVVAPTIKPVAVRETKSNESARDTAIAAETSATDGTDSEDEAEVFYSAEEEAASSDSESETASESDQHTTQIVLPRVPVKPAIVQIAERTGMEKDAMEDVIKTSAPKSHKMPSLSDSAAPANGAAIVEDLHKRLEINGKPLKSYDHVLAYTESYSVATQRNFFFFVDNKNKLRINKGTPIDVKHETLSYTLHVKEYGKKLVSHQVTGTKSVQVENFAGFIALTLPDIGIVVFVPYAFHK